MTTMFKRKLFRYRHENMPTFYLRRMREFAIALIPWAVGLALVALIAWEFANGIAP